MLKRLKRAWSTKEIADPAMDARQERLASIDVEIEAFLGNAAEIRMPNEAGQWRDAYLDAYRKMMEHNRTGQRNIAHHALFETEASYAFQPEFGHKPAVALLYEHLDLGITGDDGTLGALDWLAWNADGDWSVVTTPEREIIADTIDRFTEAIEQELLRPVNPDS